MKEVWKDVIGYEGLYQVSSTGRVRSCDAYVQSKHGKRLRKGKILKPTPNIDGYLFLTLSKEGTVSNHRVNRLVAEAFLSNPEGFEVVNHKDKNKTNNCVENLEWCTVEYNTDIQQPKQYCSMKPMGVLWLNGKQFLMLQKHWVSIYQILHNVVGDSGKRQVVTCGNTSVNSLISHDLVVILSIRNRKKLNWPSCGMKRRFWMH